MLMFLETLIIIIMIKKIDGFIVEIFYYYELDLFNSKEIIILLVEKYKLKAFRYYLN